MQLDCNVFRCQQWQHIYIYTNYQDIYNFTTIWLFKDSPCKLLSKEKLWKQSLWIFSHNYAYSLMFQSHISKQINNRSKQILSISWVKWKDPFHVLRLWLLVKIENGWQILSLIAMVEFMFYKITQIKGKLTKLIPNFIPSNKLTR